MSKFNMAARSRASLGDIVPRANNSVRKSKIELMFLILKKKNVERGGGKKSSVKWSFVVITSGDFNRVKFHLKDIL